MSGFEIAGVVLGAIPLVISALEHYKAGKGPVATFLKWRDHLDTLIFRLTLQKSLLHLDLLELLRNARIEEALEEDLTHEECIRVVRDPCNERPVQESMGIMYDIFLGTLRRYEACLMTLTENLENIQGPPGIKGNSLGALVLANDEGSINFTGRVKLTMKKTVLKDLIEELKEHSISLQAIIKAVSSQKERTQRQPSYEARALANVFEAVRQSVSPLFNAICTGHTCKCSNHRVLLRLDSRAGRNGKPLEISKKKIAKQSLLFDLMFDQEGYFHQTAVVARPKSTDAAKDREHGKLRPGTAKFSPPIVIPDNNEIYDDNLQAKIVTNICEAVWQARTTSRVLRLELVNHSLFHNSTDPTQEPYKERPPSELLNLFLRKGYHDDDHRMTPKQQTMLALDVAAAILQLHETCWLGADFKSASMHLVLDEGVHSEMLRPCLFIEKSVHKHESLFDTTATSVPEPKATLLELAIILLEIWHHQPLEACIDKLGLDCVNTLESRRIAAIRWLEMTSSRLPLYHLAAIEECLAVCSGRLRYWNDKDFIREYCENIIKPLQESRKSW